jgi:hypothetical protein
VAAWPFSLSLSYISLNKYQMLAGFIFEAIPSICVDPLMERKRKRRDWPPPPYRRPDSICRFQMSRNNLKRTITTRHDISLSPMPSAGLLFFFKKVKRLGGNHFKNGNGERRIKAARIPGEKKYFGTFLFSSSSHPGNK